jgi:opacity protein-like surface antigen
MKKIIMTAVVVMAFAFTNAQEVKFGIKGAVSLSTQTGDVENASSKVGFQAGAFAEIKITDKFSIQPEVLYSAQGVKEKGDFEYNNNVYPAELNTKLGYINVPVMAKYYVAEKFNLEAGPQIGILVSAKGEATILGHSEEGDIKDNYKTIDLGLNLGAGYDFTENLSAGLRYTLGLSNVAGDDFDDNVNAKNSVFALSLGYKF